MATSSKSFFQNRDAYTAVSKKRIALIVSEWNEEVTDALYIGAHQYLLDAGMNPENIIKIEVPGSFELPLAAQWMAEDQKIDAVICLGCIIQGETRHFEFIAQAVAQGIKDASLNTGKPVIFGVLTTENKTQALDRAGGKYGNKGEEAAVSALKMLVINENRKKSAR